MPRRARKVLSAAFDDSGCSSRFLNFSDQAQEAVKDCHRVWRASGDVKIYRNDSVRAVENFRMIAEWSA